MDFDSIIKGSIDSVKQMVRKVTDLRRIGSRVYKAVGKFDELPPVIMKVKNLVTRVTTLFKDIKNDVMGLYNVSYYYCPNGLSSISHYDNSRM